jgi:hypothetical protein
LIKIYKKKEKNNKKKMKIVKKLIIIIKMLIRKKQNTIPVEEKQKQLNQNLVVLIRDKFGILA